MEDKDKIFLAALAGLLHDVGMFAQMAGIDLTESWDENARKDYGYQHALASYGFVKQFVPEKWRGLLSGVAYHHYPKHQQDYWVQIADWLSSAEREEDENNRIPRMQSVFSGLDGYNQPHFLPLTRLNPTDRDQIFPESLSANDWKAESQRAYADLWQQFEQECQARKIQQFDNLQVYLENMLALLQDFAWCIPLAFRRNVPDVSLFDHSRTTAAITACLAYDNYSTEWCQNAKNANSPICFLVGADLSGLQSFIYTLASSGAAKSLRARSFYVQMISDVIAFYTLERLGLPLTNLLYVGGGGFQLLAPLGTEKILTEVAREVADRLLSVHGGTLGITLRWVELKYADFETFNQARDQLGKDINRAKRQPFAAASPEKLLATIGQPISQGGDPIKFCHVTGEDGDTLGEDKDREPKSKFVLSLEDLGMLLPKATHILLTTSDPLLPSTAVDWQTALLTFGLDVQIVTLGKPPKPKDVEHKFARIWCLNPQTGKETTYLEGIAPQLSVFSYRPFARLTPTDRLGNPLTFDDLAKPMRGNFQRWGVLRMDVDNLGTLFQKGFGQKASLSRAASLSFAMRLFFEGWLPQLAKPQPNDPLAKTDLSQHVYIQYSGGDDLFVVGAWDALPEFARRIRQSFGEYACGNPKVTLSGGMTMVDRGFPLYQAAEMAGEAESAAKSFQRSGKEQGKDAFTFLEMPLDWQTFATIRQQAEMLAHGVESHRLPRALLQTLISLHAQVQETRRKGQKPRFGPWTWMAAYQLTRMANQAKDEDKQSILELRDKFLIPDAQTEALGLAARWAQYLTRGG